MLLKVSSKEVKTKLNKLKNKPKLEKEADTAGKELRTMKAEKEKCEGDLSKLKKELSDKTLLLDSLREETRRSEERIIELKRRKAEIETFGIVPTEFDTTESLDEIYGKIKILLKAAIYCDFLLKCNILYRSIFGFSGLYGI